MGSEFLPGLVLPAGYHSVLRRCLAEMSVADTAVNCLIAQAVVSSRVRVLAGNRSVVTLWRPLATETWPLPYTKLGCYQSLLGGFPINNLYYIFHGVYNNDFVGEF